MTNQLPRRAGVTRRCLTNSVNRAKYMNAPPWPQISASSPGSWTGAPGHPSCSGCAGSGLRRARRDLAFSAFFLLSAAAFLLLGVLDGLAARPPHGPRAAWERRSLMTSSDADDGALGLYVRRVRFLATSCEAGNQPVVPCCARRTSEMPFLCCFRKRTVHACGAGSALKEKASLLPFWGTWKILLSPRTYSSLPMRQSISVEPSSEACSEKRRHGLPGYIAGRESVVVVLILATARSRIDVLAAQLLAEARCGSSG